MGALKFESAPGEGVDIPSLVSTIRASSFTAPKSGVMSVDGDKLPRLSEEQAEDEHLMEEGGRSGVGSRRSHRGEGDQEESRSGLPRLMSGPDKQKSSSGRVILVHS